MLKKKTWASYTHTYTNKHTHFQTYSHKHIQKYFMEKDVRSMVLLCLNFIAIYSFVSLAFFLVIMQDISTVWFIEVWLLLLIISCHIVKIFHTIAWYFIYRYSTTCVEWKCNHNSLSHIENTQTPHFRHYFLNIWNNPSFMIIVAATVAFLLTLWDI